jgi:CheY-like chemotaxis protein
MARADGGPLWETQGDDLRLNWEGSRHDRLSWQRDLLILAESYLEKQGHKTLTASTLEQALALIDSENEIDVLFTDLGLGNDLQAGLELAKQAVERRPKLRASLRNREGQSSLNINHSVILAFRADAFLHRIDELQHRQKRRLWGTGRFLVASQCRRATHRVFLKLKVDPMHCNLRCSG